MSSSSASQAATIQKTSSTELVKIQAHARLRLRARDRRHAIRFRPFIDWAWPIVEPGVELIPNRHIDVIAEHLEAVTAGECRRLLINIPPGHGKSLIVSVFWPVWHWLKHPEWRFLCGSNTLSLSIRDNVRARLLVESAEFRREYMPSWSLSADQNAKTLYENTRRGSRQAISVGARIIGHRGDTSVLDDPNDAGDAYSVVNRDSVKTWYDSHLSTRLNPARDARVVVGQRIHDDDLSGHLLKRGGFDHICLPSEFEPSTASPHDWRKEKGELLFPQIYSREVLERSRVDLGPTGYGAQHDQRPALEEGAILKRSWFKTWTQLPAWLEVEIQSWDLAFKDLKSSAYVVGQVWGRSGKDIYLLDEMRAHMGAAASARAIKVMREKWPNAMTVLVEDKANGPSVIEALRSEIPGIVPVNPQGGKIARTYAVEGIVESGCVYIPSRDLCPWIDEWLEEVTRFPFAKYDDRVDAATQAIMRLRRSTHGIKAKFVETCS